VQNTFFAVVEITGKKRTITGVHTHTAFAVGYMLNSLFGYFLRDWRQFYFYFSLTPIPYFIIHFFVSILNERSNIKQANLKCH